MAPIRLEPHGEYHLADVTAMLDDPGALRFTRVPDRPRVDFAQRRFGT